MSDEHGWPDFSDPDGSDGADGHYAHGDQYDHGDQHGAPGPGTDSPFHDDLFGHDDADPHGFGAAEVDAGDDFDAGHDDAGGHDFDGGHDPAESRDAAGWDDHEPGTGHDDAAGSDVVDVTDGHAMGPVGADPDAAADFAQVSAFPPAVDVGPLPEPVDGFPWIDTGSLGLYHSGLDAAALAEPAGTEPVAAQDLAAYAAEELPPGVDPWAALAESDDPATSALAKWWNPDS